MNKAKKRNNMLKNKFAPLTEKVKESNLNDPNFNEQKFLEMVPLAPTAVSPSTAT